MKRNLVVLAVVGWVVAVAAIVILIAVSTSGPSRASADRGGRRDRRPWDRRTDDNGPRRTEEGRSTAEQAPDRAREVREAALFSDLQTLRSQIELYKVQHLDEYPGLRNGQFDGDLFVDQFLRQTNTEGNVQGAAEGGDFPYGPYLQRMPSNPFVPEDVATEVLGGPGPCPGDGTSGWWFNTTTGQFGANDAEHKDL